MALAASSDAQRNPRFARPKREAYNTATGHVQSSLQSRYNTVIGNCSVAPVHNAVGFARSRRCGVCAIHHFKPSSAASEFFCSLLKSLYCVRLVINFLLNHISFQFYTKISGTCPACPVLTQLHLQTVPIFYKLHIHKYHYHLLILKP